MASVRCIPYHSNYHLVEGGALLCLLLRSSTEGVQTVSRAKYHKTFNN